ncbi:MAG: ATP-binding cassette domain-containing protein [Lachnospiraceae bacterium]|nr:ATP-binding cassette domain-containing protein [Lachnospiraceae bacterium]
MKQELCRLRHISFAYQGQEPVLRDVDLTIYRGEMLLITGPSGGGKSTLLQILNGVLLEHVGGELEGSVCWIDRDGREKNLNETGPAVRAALIGTVMQNADDQIIYDKTEDEVAFVLENLGVEAERMPERIKGALTRMGLTAGLQTLTLSGGQKQRLVTATTLAMEQELIILDEPLANLDVGGAVCLLRQLKALTAGGKAVILIEHRLDLLHAFIDRWFWLEAGRLQEVEREHLPVSQALAGRPSLPPSKPGTGEICLRLTQAAFLVKKQVILQPLDFTLCRGERWLIVGDNGGGKSTFLQLLSGIIKPSLGSYFSRFRPKEHFSRVGMILQNPSYQLFMPTVRAELELHCRSRERSKRLLEHFGLSALAERHPHSLSEGQKRRLGIAAVLATEPEILLLDEPTVGLDPISLEQLLDALERFCDPEKLTTVSITHDERCAGLLGNRVLWIRNGRCRSGGMELFTEYKREGGSLC